LGKFLTHLAGLNFSIRNKIFLLGITEKYTRINLILLFNQSDQGPVILIWVRLDKDGLVGDAKARARHIVNFNESHLFYFHIWSCKKIINLLFRCTFLILSN